MTAVLDASAIRLDLPYDRLVLTSEDSGERLEFSSQVPLEGATWQSAVQPRWPAAPTPA